MGDDFSSHQLFAGTSNANQCRSKLIAALRHYFEANGFQEIADEDQATRSIVIGPAGRWIFIGDSAATNGDQEAFTSLSLAISAIAPVVDTVMSDDATLHFYLYRRGHLQDKFGNGAFPFFKFATEEDAAAFRGNPESWADLLTSSDDVQTLRAAWVQDWQAVEILGTTGRLLGWKDELLRVGYTNDMDGVPLRFDEYLEGSGVDLTRFEVFHFAPA
jgi:hypothetical protein